MSDTICIGLSFGTSVHEQTSDVEHCTRAAHERRRGGEGANAWILSNVVSI